MSTLQESVAVVTGAASGIGRAIAKRYASEGARVVVSDVDEEGGQETVSQIQEANGEARFIAADVSDPEACQDLVRQTVEAYGTLTIACNNAGIGGEQVPTVEYPVDAWQKVLSINLSGVFYGMKAQIPAMLEAGGGAIVNVASILGQVGFETSSAYVAAKHGVVGLTKNAALEVSAKGVRINSVGPGFIRTPLLDGLDDDTMEMLVGRHPIGRLGEADEVADVVLWLSSPQASFVTGAYVPVDGGYLAR
ncbi:MAG: SDR family NAD(P)-dependent oxidoreductase [Rubricoccaceae bacterium]